MAKPRNNRGGGGPRMRGSEPKAPPKGLPAAKFPGNPFTGLTAAQQAAPKPPPQWTPDSGYNDAVSLAKRNYEAALGGYDKAERETEHEFGFNDPTNPFSRVNEAKRTFLGRGKAITASTAARGHLYSGIHQARRDANLREEDKHMAAQRRAYEERLDAIRTGRATAASTREEEELRARMDSMTRQGAS